MAENQTRKLKGGTFLIAQSSPEDVFIPEEITEEQSMIAEAVREFCEQEIHSMGVVKVAELSATKDRDKIVELLDKAALMGFCGVGIAEEYGGIDLDFLTGLVFVEAVSLGMSFATTIGVQTSIGSLPIVYYGTPEQRAKYLPGIASAEIKSCYCLTEPTAGSDANSGKTKATFSPDGKHYLLTGQKMWITNGGFANLFVVFAKIEEDENLSAFIVEKAFGGITIGPEEKKLGIKATSTTQIFFNEVPVPLENLLGERGGGFKMALNILNTGRIKLAAGAIGGSKFGITKGIEYAIERKQFDKSISEFGAMKYKIGEMATRTFAAESAIYRTGRNVDLKEAELKAGGMDPYKAKIKAVREFAIECAILKVYGSEVASYTVDEVLQIYGGMGYSVETGVELGYRDARILRIFEGTNEINRMLSVAELTKRALKTKEIDLLGAGKKVPGYIFKQVLPFKSKAGMAEEIRLVENMKRVFMLISGGAGKKLGKKMVDEQEIVMNLADILAEVYIAESTLLRVMKLQGLGKDKAKLKVQHSLLQLFIYEALDKVRKAGTDAINSYAEGGHRNMMLRMLKILTPKYKVNPKELRREVADYLIGVGGYVL